MSGPGTRILYRDLRLEGRFTLQMSIFYAGTGPFSSPPTLAHDTPEANQQLRIDLVGPSAPIGSMNKVFTAVATLQLVEAHKLALEDPIGKHLPDYPNKEVAAKVTVRHLLTHTGGTGDIFGPEFGQNRLALREHPRLPEALRLAWAHPRAGRPL
jgi:CubicO group peptidase (beta-lactamase class C family)